MDVYYAWQAEQAAQQLAAQQAAQQKALPPGTAPERRTGQAAVAIEMARSGDGVVLG